MKRLIALLFAGMLAFGTSTAVLAQEDPDTTGAAATMDADSGSTAMEDDSTTAAAPATDTKADASSAADGAKAEEKVELTFHQAVKQKFIEGGPGFMAFVLICLILGLAIAIERVVYLSMATTNTKSLLNKVEEALSRGGIEAAKEVCRNTRGPVASIFYQGLSRSSEGIEMVEKSVESYGSVQMGLLEKNVSWISLFIALAPMLGFFGTVIGMIDAFDAIAAANNISPGIVAGGIGVALITTVSGLLVAMILQVFYNFIVAKIDGIVNDMEDASISFVDLLLKYQIASSGNGGAVSKM